MGRVRDYIEVEGRVFWALFDTGARNTYLIPSVASVLSPVDLKEPFRAALGGSVKETTQAVILEAKVRGCPIATQALVVDRIGEDEQGRPIDVLIGALAMQQWGIRPVPDREELDMSRYSKEFLEF